MAARTEQQYVSKAELERSIKKAAKEAAKQTAKATSGHGTGGVVKAPAPLRQATVFGESKQTRFLDGLINVGVAGATVLWTASRPTEGQQLGWGAFWMGLGTLMLVQGSHELRYGGGAVAAANAAFVSLRLFHPNLSGT